MAEFRLKTGQERFRVVDGPYENREYLPGVTYTDIPPGEAARFAPVAEPVVAKKSKSPEVNNA